MAEYYNGLTSRLELGNVPLGHVLDPQLEPGLETDACPVGSYPLNAPPNWIGDDKELLFLGKSPQVYGLWNAYGKKLGLLSKRQERVIFADIIEDPRDDFLIFADNMLSIFTHDRPPPNPNRIYAPIRHRKLASLVASYPNGETE